MSEVKKGSTSPEATPASVESVVSPSPTLGRIQEWVSTWIHNSPVSRNTEAYNYLMKRLPELASMIDKEKKA